jgi:hypothetical protein
VREDAYVAIDLRSGLQIGYDRVRLHETADGLRLDSRHTAFGSALPVQEVRFHLERDWTPRRLEARSEAWSSLEVRFGMHETRIVARRHGRKRRLTVPVGRRHAIFFLSGGFSFPLHAVRRFPPQEPGPVRFQIVPEGTCEMRACPAPPAGTTLHLLEMRLSLPHGEDLLHLAVGANGDLVRFHARNRSLLVQREGSELLC